MTNAPALFRLILQVPDLDQAAKFYAKLLADEGRGIPRATSRRLRAAARKRQGPR